MIGEKEQKGREGKGREGKGREGKGREGKGRGRHWTMWTDLAIGMLDEICVRNNPADADQQRPPQHNGGGGCEAGSPSAVFSGIL